MVEEEVSNEKLEKQADLLMENLRRDHFETITFKFEELVREIQVELRSKKKVVTLMNETMPLDPTWLTVKLQVVRTRGKCYTLAPAKGTKNKIPNKMRIIGSAYPHKITSL